MERKIGDSFEYEGKIFKVEEDKNFSCHGCFFHKKCTVAIKKTVGQCQAGFRGDNKDVVFVKVAEEAQTEEVKEQPQYEEQLQAEKPQEEPQKLNLCEILKDCPKGTKLYSTVLGYVIFQGIVEGVVYPIVVSCENGVTKTFTADGKMFIDFDGECTLFPSKEQRSWADFIAPWHKKERFDPKTLQSFDRVLVKYEDNNWLCSFFSHHKDVIDSFPIHACVYCIPYNDDTKHLVGTTDEAPDFYKYWED